MAIDIEQSVRAFMEEAERHTTTVGQDNHGKYAVDLRIALIDEEYDELIEAINNRDKVQIAKELCDLVYVVVGTALAMGIPFNQCFGALQISNMSKFDGDPEIREDGKVLKGKNFRPAEDAIKQILG